MASSVPIPVPAEPTVPNRQRRRFSFEYDWRTPFMGGIGETDLLRPSSNRSRSISVPGRLLRPVVKPLRIRTSSNNESNHRSWTETLPSSVDDPELEDFLRFEPPPDLREQIGSAMTLFWKKKKFVVNIPDPSYNVVYLGNVITTIAKGDGCYEKALALIWKTYCTRSRPDIPMKLVITRSGLKAHTKAQGLTEYWAHRITFCTAPKEYPKVFVWIYKHEGKRMKPELRCHAALCKKPDWPDSMKKQLTEMVLTALKEYKREKISRQNVRLTGSQLPRRKQLLSTGVLNFRPPMSRSKSAPKLVAIAECMEEDEGSEDDLESEYPEGDEGSSTCSTGATDEDGAHFVDEQDSLPSPSIWMVSTTPLPFPKSAQDSSPPSSAPVTPEYEKFFPRTPPLDSHFRSQDVRRNIDSDFSFYYSQNAVDMGNIGHLSIDDRPIAAEAPRQSPFSAMCSEPTNECLTPPRPSVASNRTLTDTEDTISDESGYHEEEKGSTEGSDPKTQDQDVATHISNNHRYYETRSVDGKLIVTFL